MVKNGRHFILLVVVTLATDAVPCFSTTNPFHLTQAVGTLTMEECLSCHDGVTGMAVTVCLGNECLYTKNHSLMHRYPPAGKEGRYAPQSVVEEAGCVLEGGKITCLSCHNLANPAPHLVRDGDNLCLICHIDRTSR